MHDTRPKLLMLLTDPQIGKIVVEQRDRLMRFGFLYLEQLFAMQGRFLEVLFPSDTKYDLGADFIAAITSMASWIYGRWHSKERAEKIKQCVEQVMKRGRRAPSIQIRHVLALSHCMRNGAKQLSDAPILSA